MVTGIGQCSWDYLALVEAYPLPDAKQEILCWQEQGGGPVATALVTLARLGEAAKFWGVVGDDDIGRMIITSLSGEGIDVAGLQVRPNANSQRAFISIEQHTGLRTIFWQRPSGRPLSPDELPVDFLDKSRFLLLDGLMFDVSRLAATHARKRQIPVMLDAGRMRPGMMELAALSDYLVAGEQFFLDLGWDGSKTHFMALAAATGAAVVTVTLGRRGSFTWLDNGVLSQEALTVDAVDTTGAGDVFHGGYVFGVLQGWPLEKVLLFASAISALKCLHIGGRSGIPTLSTVLAFLLERTGKEFCP